MAINFPDSPTNGQTTTINGVVYTYNSASGWETITSTLARAVASDTYPANPSDGDLWFNSTTGDLMIKYNDGTSSQWVSINGAPGIAGPPGWRLRPSLSSISESIIPDTDSAYDLGSPTKKFRSLYLSSDTLFLAATLELVPAVQLKCLRLILAQVPIRFQLQQQILVIWKLLHLKLEQVLIQYN